jgi:hypothetical protein
MPHTTGSPVVPSPESDSPPVVDVAPALELDALPVMPPVSVASVELPASVPPDVVGAVVDPGAVVDSLFPIVPPPLSPGQPQSDTTPSSQNP